MRARNLMVGDWILAEGEPVQVTVLSVLGGDIIRVIKPMMSYDIAYASNKVALANGARDLKYIKPIPLASEILEKFGFTDKQQKDHFIYNKIMIKKNCHNLFSFFITTGNNNYCKVCDLLYVHELQHILKSLSIDKEIYL